MNLATTRLNKELKDYMKLKNANNDIELTLRDKINIFKWQAKVKGPPDTPYTDGVFLINIDVPEDYPITAPKCKFITQNIFPQYPNEYSDEILWL